MNIDFADIGLRIRRRRKELGFSQEKVACCCSITVSYLSQIECGKKLASLAPLMEISVILKCSLDWLVLGKIPGNSNNLLYDFNAPVEDLKPDEQEYLYSLMTRNIELLKSRK